MFARNSLDISLVMGHIETRLFDRLIDDWLDNKPADRIILNKLTKLLAKHYHERAQIR